MKKGIILAIIFLFFSLAVSAQGFYFDIGVGFGKGWTFFDFDERVKTLKSVGLNVNDVAVDLGLKAGYIIFEGFYVVGEFGMIGHRIFDNSTYIQYNSFIIGPGIIGYPVAPTLNLPF